MRLFSFSRFYHTPLWNNLIISNLVQGGTTYEDERNIMQTFRYRDLKRQR